MSKRSELQKEYYKMFGSYRKDILHYNIWLEDKIIHSKLSELEQENKRIKERQDKCKHEFKEVHYVNDDYTPIGLFGVFCINCEKENKHI